MRKVTFGTLIILITLLFGAKIAVAAVVWQMDSGQLIGALGVDVNGTPYDVAFKEGTCASVFGVCDAAHFDFTSFDTAEAASKALLDQVFINTTDGPFDDTPNLTYGISDVSIGYILTPFGLQGSYINYSTAANSAVESLDEWTGGGSVDNSLYDSARYPRDVWADWTVRQGSVPEPGSLSLIAVATFLAAVVTSRRKRI